MNGLERFITSIENEKLGPRRSALIQNMYYHILSNDLHHELGKRIIMYQLCRFEKLGEEVGFWKAKLVNQEYISDKLKNVVKVVKDLSQEIDEEVNINKKSQLQYTLMCIVVTYPQLFMINLNRKQFMDFMWINSRNVEKYTNQSVQELFSILNGDLHPLKKPVIDELSEDSMPELIDDPLPDTASLDPLPDTASLETASLVCRCCEEVHGGDILCQNCGCPTRVQQVSDDSDDSDYEPEETESEDVFTAEELWNEYENSELTIDTFCNIFSKEFEFDEIYSRLIKEEASNILLNLKIIDYADILIEIHRKTMYSLYGDQHKNTFERFDEYVNSMNDCCYITLFTNFFQNIDNMFWIIQEENEQQIIDRLDRFGFKNKFVDIFKIYAGVEISEDSEKEFIINQRDLLSDKDDKESFSFSEESSYYSEDESSYYSEEENSYYSEEESSYYSEEENSYYSDEESSYYSDKGSYYSEEESSYYSDKESIESFSFSDKGSYYSDSYYSEEESSYYSEEIPADFKYVVHNIDMLISHCSQNDPNEVNDEGNTLLMEAVRWRQDVAVVFLSTLENINPNIQNPSGKTALHMTCGKLHENRWSYVPILLEMGADPNIVCDSNKTPMFYAIQRNALATVKALKNAVGFDCYKHRNLLKRVSDKLFYILN